MKGALILSCNVQASVLIAQGGSSNLQHRGMGHLCRGIWDFKVSKCFSLDVYISVLRNLPTQTSAFGTGDLSGLRTQPSL